VEVGGLQLIFATLIWFIAEKNSSFSIVIANKSKNALMAFNLLVERSVQERARTKPFRFLAKLPHLLNSAVAADDSTKYNTIQYKSTSAKSYIVTDRCKKRSNNNKNVKM